MSLFAINYDADTPQPSDVRPSPRPIVDTNLDGDSISQGYEEIEVIYANITFANMAILQGFYDPNNQNVTVTYDDSKTGGTVTRNAKMQPIQIGGVLLDIWKDASVRFTRLTPLDGS
jgi:hypothetical protein